MDLEKEISEVSYIPQVTEQVFEALIPKTTAPILISHHCRTTFSLLSSSGPENTDLWSFQEPKEVTYNYAKMETEKTQNTSNVF